MLNFRVKPEFVDELDRSAAAAGLNRSDFMRKYVEEAVRTWGGKVRPSEIAKPDDRTLVRASSISEKPVPPSETCLHPEGEVVKTPWGVKVCQRCGARMA